jgi:hypothetical protein
MKRIKITAICISLLATLSMVGCMSHPAGYYGGMHRVGYGNGDVFFSGDCDPCGGIAAGCGSSCGVIEYGGGPYVSNPCISNPCGPKIASCRKTFSNLSNGVLLIGRGVLDVTAAPFVLVGNLLSSGCRYEVITICDDVQFGAACYPVASDCQPIAEPCAPACAPACNSGCDSCNGGYTEGIRYNNGHRQNGHTQYNTEYYNTQSRTILPPSPRPYRNNPVIQAGYMEPTAPAVRFVQPR